MQEKGKHSSQPLGICRRLFTFIMDSLLVRRLAITSHHPMPQGSNNRVVVSVEEQQPLVPNKLNRAERIYIQQPQHTLKEKSGFEIQIHHKQTDVDDHSKTTGNPNDNRKVSSSKSLQEAKPRCTSISKANSPKKSLSIAGLEKENDNNKKKGMMPMSNEKVTLAMVNEEDERFEVPLSRASPLQVYVAPNINEKSDEFIRSRKEAMRRSQTL